MKNQKLKLVIESHINHAADGHQFDARLGWEQCERAAKMKAKELGNPNPDFPAAHRAYGAWEALTALLEELVL
jgi:hypothetical protein